MLDFRATLLSRIGADDVKALAREAALYGEVCDAIVALVHDTDPVVARNAAWVMSHFDTTLVRLLRPKRDSFIDVAIHTDNVPLRRLLLAVVERQGMERDDVRTDFLNFCLSHAADAAEQPGVQSLCMKLAYQQCRHYPELLQEFYAVLGMMTEGYAKCVQCLRKKYLAQQETQNTSR